MVAVLPDLEICLTYGTDGLQHMELNGMDVTAEIRLPEVSRYASLVSAYPWRFGRTCWRCSASWPGRTAW